MEPTYLLLSGMGMTLWSSRFSATLKVPSP